LAREEGIGLWTEPLTQVAWGLALAGMWAGLRTLGQAEGRRRGWLRVAPELEDEALRAGGHGLRQGVSLTLQSAIAEETLFRLLALSLLSWVTGVPWLAVAVTAALWSLVHADSGLWPRWPRKVELGVAGLALGAVVLEVGFLAALVAHAVFNATLLSTPLLAALRRRTGRAVRGRSAPPTRPREAA
jgi:membrane protease YdiL (CAAX protease family)